MNKKLVLVQPVDTSRQGVANILPSVSDRRAIVTFTPDNLRSDFGDRTRGCTERQTSAACDLREFADAAHLVYAVDFPAKNGGKGMEYNFLPSRFIYFWNDKDFFAFTEMVYKKGASWIGAFHAPDGKDRPVPGDGELGRIAIEAEVQTRLNIFRADLGVASRTYYSRDLKTGDGLRNAENEYRSFVVDCINYHLRTFKKSARNILGFGTDCVQRLLALLWQEVADATPSQRKKDGASLPYSAETLRAEDSER